MSSLIRTICRDLVRSHLEARDLKFRMRNRRIAVQRRIARLTDQVDEIWLVMQAMRTVRASNDEWEAVHNKWVRLETRRQAALLRYDNLLRQQQKAA